MIKSLFFLLFVFILISDCKACFCAEHHRKFPFGVLNDTIIVFETHLNRSDYIDHKSSASLPPEPYWFGTIELGFYSINSQKYYSKSIADITINPNMDFKNTISMYYQKELDFFNKNDAFQLAKPLDITMCDFQRTCYPYELIENTEKELTLLKTNDKTIEIKDLKDSLSPLFNLYFYHQFRYNLVKEKLHLSSIRHYKIGNRNLSIFHLASGSPAESSNAEVYPTNPKSYRPEFFEQFLSISNAIFEEPVLSHGKGYDWMIVE